ncbi:MAG: membrane protein insertion efficiency factor YidD [Planctomycetaceae bacterium]
MAWLTRVVRGADRLLVPPLVRAVRGYQWLVSPWLGRNCRFQPTCSEYFRIVVERDGAIVGTVRGVKRICRCHPWNPGGYDPP